MKKILVVIITLTSFLAKSQELTVFYKEKRIPAKSLVKESVDYSEVTLFFNQQINELHRAINAGLSKDSIVLFEQEIERRADSIHAIITEKASGKKPIKIPTYDYVTILKVNKNESLYYPQNQVGNDTISRTSFNEKGEKSVDARINYNDSEIIYLDTFQKKKISALKIHKFDF